MAKKAEVQERTDHSEQIGELRKVANTHREHGLVTTAVLYAGAADLLETHDATGISLEQFGAVGNLVNFALDDLGFEPFTPNGV